MTASDWLVVALILTLAAIAVTIWGIVDALRWHPLRRLARWLAPVTRRLAPVGRLLRPVGTLVWGVWLWFRHRPAKEPAVTVGGVVRSGRDDATEADLIHLGDAIRAIPPAADLANPPSTTVYPAAPQRPREPLAGDTTLPAAGALPVQHADLGDRLAEINRFAEQTRLRLAMRTRTLPEQTTRLLPTVEPQAGPFTQEFWRQIDGETWEQTALLDLDEVRHG